MKKKTVILCCVAAVIVCAVGAVFLMHDGSQDQPPAREGFVDNGLGEPYFRKVPLSKMDFVGYGKYFNTTYTLLDYPINFEQMFVLPCDVHYYKSPGNKKPVLTIPAGTEITMFPEPSIGNSFFDGRQVGYGLRCWPDYREGWRYGQPFTNELIVDAFMGDAPKYYVKTSELGEVAGAFYDAYEDIFWDAIRVYDGEKSREGFVYWVTRYIDERLFENGVFCSYDLSPEPGLS